MAESVCIHCGAILVEKGGVRLCKACNVQASEQAELPFAAVEEHDDYLFIECPGVTIYDSETMEIIQGAKFRSEANPELGYDIIGAALFAPAHTSRRRIRREAYGRIRRCQACQDLTIRLRRPEGVDFCIPSVRFPKRTKLRSVEPIRVASKK